MVFAFSWRIIPKAIKIKTLWKSWNYQYKNSGKPANRIVGIPALAQAYVSIVRQEPHLARAKPASLVKLQADYAKVFSDTPLLCFGRRETNAHLAMTVCCLANK